MRRVTHVTKNPPQVGKTVGDAKIYVVVPKRLKKRVHQETVDGGRGAN